MKCPHVFKIRLKQFSVEHADNKKAYFLHRSTRIEQQLTAARNRTFTSSSKMRTGPPEPVGFYLHVKLQVCVATDAIPTHFGAFLSTNCHLSDKEAPPLRKQPPPPTKT